MNNTQFATNYATVAVVVLMIGGAPFLGAATPAAPGDQRRWTLDFRTRLEQGARPVEIDLSGEWSSTISAVRTGEYDAALQLVNAHVSSPANKVPDSQSEPLRRRLERPFWATYRADGSLLAVHFYQDTEPSDRNLLQMVATETQFVNASPDRPSWIVNERDAAGEYLASYNRTAPNGVIKHRVKYVQTNGVPVEIEQSEFLFTLDSDGGTAALDAKIRVRMRLAAGSAGQIAAATETHLSNLRKSEAPEMIGSLAHALPNLVSSVIRTHKTDPAQSRARLDAQLLEGRTTESLLNPANDSDRLAALFRQRPEATALALEKLRKSGPNSKITDALGSAGSPAAVQVLGTIVRDRGLARALRIDALSAFILMQSPSAEAMRTPAGLLDDEAIASAARIASGALAKSGRAAHPEEADKIDTALVARYQKTQDAAELAELLGALGNSMGKSVTPVIESALGDPREAVRIAGIRALRLAEGSEVEGLLCGAMLNDPDAGVRAAAIFAASFRRPLGSKVGEALVRAAKADSAEHVRVSAINLLRRQPSVNPHFAETMQWIAGHDARPGVRRLAEEALKVP